MHVTETAHRMQTPPDKYRFRFVLANVMATPCAAACGIVGLMWTNSVWVAAVVAIAVGIPLASLLAWMLFVAGHSMFGWLDRRLGGKSRD